MTSDKINNSSLNIMVDTILLLLLLPMAGIGFLMKYVLIAGEERMTQYGPFTDLEFLGLQRHEWGTIHLIISLIFMALLLLHIILHWTFITSVFCKLLPCKPVRISLTILAAAIILLSLVGPFFVNPEKAPYSPHYRNRFSDSGQSVNIYSIPTGISTPAGNQIVE